MTLLKAYLQKSSTQRVLSRKPGEKGFSLIELVVVVAVLAILAAIAIPQFTSLSDDARLNTTKSIMANMLKECEYNKARSGTASHSDTANQTINGVTWGGQLASGTTTCAGAGYAELDDAAGTSKKCIVVINLITGAQTHDLADNFAAISAESGWPENLEACV